MVPVGNCAYARVAAALGAPVTPDNEARVVRALEQIATSAKWVTLWLFLLWVTLLAVGHDANTRALL